MLESCIVSKKRLTWTGFLCCGGFYRGRLSWFGCLYSWCGGFCGWKHIINNLILTKTRIHFHSNKSLFISNEIPFHFNYAASHESDIHKLNHKTPNSEFMSAQRGTYTMCTVCNTVQNYYFVPVSPAGLYICLK